MARIHIYDTTLAAFQALQRSYAPQRINIVVLLTDGINDDPSGGINRAELLRRLKAEQDKERPVRIITIGRPLVRDNAVASGIAPSTVPAMRSTPSGT